MDLFMLIIVVISIVIIFSLCGACCRKKRVPLTYTATVVSTVPVSNTVTVSNQAPYPIQQNMMPVPAHSGLNVGIIGCPYPTNPQPGFMPGLNQPYPQMAPISAMSQQNPPSYAEATGVYAKQSPYNPQYP